MRALVTGATGFVGPYLLDHLDRPVVVSRNAARARAELSGRDIDVREYDLNVGPPPLAAVGGVDAVFHLAGESIAGRRWTKEHKRRIRDSRVDGTRNLVDALAQLPAGERPRVLVSASAVGFYGSRGEETLSEESPPGSDYLAEVCVAWEQEAARAVDLGIRTAMVRTGMALGPGGGALEKMLPPFRLGVGGRLGNGRQWMPWIHVEDLAALFVHVANTDAIRGPVNAVAPGLVRNRELTRSLAKALHRPAFLPAPYLGLRLMFGEVAKALFASQRVESRVAAASGFVFRYPQIDEALQAVLHGNIE